MEINKYKEPRITSSKKACNCSETGKDICKFETILFDPKTNKTYCKESKEYIQFTSKKLGNA